MLEKLRLNRRQFVQATGLAVLASAAAGSAQATEENGDGSASPVDPGEAFDHLDRAAISVFARDLETGEPIAAHDASVPVPPASTTKLLTTATAFDELGPGYRFETTVGVVGERRNDRVVDSLGVVARGDPDLTGDDLRALAKAVADAGIRRVTDRLVVDVSAFDAGEYPPAWTLGDARYSYGSKSSAFAVAQNDVDVTVSRRGDDCAFDVEVEPDSGLIDVDVDLECVDKDRYVTITRPDHWTNAVEVAGRMVPGDEATASVPVGTPDEHAAGVFARALEAEGVAVASRGSEPAIEISREPIDLSEVVATHESRPLLAIAEGLNAWSYNVVAENVARTVAFEREGVGSWAAWEGILGEAFAAAGAETPQIRDGSGLSRHDLASARDVVSMIEWGLEQPWEGAFRESMAIAGETGTVRNRLADVDATVRAKSGSLRGVTCLAGVIEDEGEPVASYAVLAANLTGERASGASGRVDDLVAMIADAAT